MLFNSILLSLLDSVEFSLIGMLIVAAHVRAVEQNGARFFRMVTGLHRLANSDIKIALSYAVRLTLQVGASARLLHNFLLCKALRGRLVQTEVAQLDRGQDRYEERECAINDETNDGDGHHERLLVEKVRQEQILIQPHVRNKPWQDKVVIAGEVNDD